MTGVDAHLPDWLEIEHHHRWRGVLLGNGASMVHWPRFGYASLFEVACSLGAPAALTPGDRALFAKLDARWNFEHVLHDLAVARRVVEALGRRRRTMAAIDERYRHIREALIAAVQAVHVPYGTIVPTTLERIAAYLAKQRYVFSTNYDLLTYWAIMRTPTRFADFFLNGEFDRAVGRLYPRRTRVLYPHGALHLYRTLRSGPRKNQHRDGANLLARFGRPIGGEDTFPIVVSEGDARQKRMAIEESPYLSFAYEELAAFDDPLVIFGSHLGEPDQHLVEAIVAHPERPLAVSIRPAADADVKRMKHHYGEVLSVVREILFFDSTTHPLGDPQAFVWGGPMDPSAITAQLAPLKTVVLTCPRCTEQAFVIGRASRCWACGYPKDPGRLPRRSIELALRRGRFRVESRDARRPPFRCPACTEPTLVNVGLKRRGMEHDTFHCFRCGAGWPPGALAPCPSCDALYDRRARGARACPACTPPRASGTT